MAVIEFKEYRVNKMVFSHKDHKSLHAKNRIIINPIFGVNIQDISKTQTSVELSMHLSADSPIELSVSVIGVFEYHEKEDKKAFGKEHIVSNNAVAILFPYLRSTISILTNLTNDLPTLNLPTMNIAELMEKQNQSQSQGTKKAD